MRPSRFRILSLTLLLLGIGPYALASGFSIFEEGAKATGMGGAFAATADDPSAIFYNVAGIAYQRQAAAMAGGTVITFKNSFSGADYEFPGPGTTAKYEDHIFVLPNVYAIAPIGENMTVGVGMFTAFGLRTHWENQDKFVGRFLAQDTNLKTVSIEPAFAWKTSNGKFALGLGAEYRGSTVSLARNISAVNPFTLQVVDIGHVRISTTDEISDAWGYNVGMMFRPIDNWSIGLNYRSDMTIDYNGKADFTQISTGNPQFDAAVAKGFPPDQNVKTSISYPAFYHIGIATTTIPTWTIEFDAVMQGWSTYKELVVDFANASTPDLVSPQGWKDSWSYRLGANKKVTDNWDIRLGALYDKTPQPVEVVGPLLPDSDRVGISFGLGFTTGKWTAEVTELFLPFIDRNTLGQNSDNFNGIYQTTANLVTFDLGYKF